MKRIYYIIAIAIVVIVLTGYLFTRFSFLKTSDPKPAVSKSESPLDLRPLIVQKLQQLVKQGSDGLYNLSVQDLQPDILNSTLTLTNATLLTDSAALKKLDSLKKAPDDIFNFSFQNLRITGINIDDMVHQDRIDVDSIFITRPVIRVYHNPRSYNERQRQRDSSLTLYKKLRSGLKHLGIKNIVVESGSLIHTNSALDNRVQRFNDISLHIHDLLFDSTTEFDKSRFLFSKEVLLSCRNYIARTPDSLYLFKVASISVDAVKRTMTGRHLALLPRKNFEKKVKYMENRFKIQFPKVVFNNIDWWALINNESFTSENADLYDVHAENFVDRSKPLNPNMRQDNFPQQLLMRVPMNVNIAKLSVHHASIAYEEYEPEIARSAKVSFDNINGVLRNVTNVPSSIQKNGFASFDGSSLFMHSVPLSAHFKFNLVKQKTGDFSVSMQMGTLNRTIVNSFAEPMGMFSFKSGELQHASGFAQGNNTSSTANMELLYKDLHITPLKRDKDDTTSLKKKTVTSFIANTFFIKDANPSKGEDIRRPTVTIQRDHYDGFFRFVWKSMLAGILKTIGVPQKYMKQ